MLKITPTLQLDENEPRFDYIRASGPGGQNVNKVAPAVQLRFDIINSHSLPSNIKGRLIQLAGNRVNADGVLLIEAKRYRTQQQNREDALQKLSELVRRASERPKKRTKTKPTRASNVARLKEKKRRGEIKRQRNESFDKE
jgi:ribosome-associated protein